MNFVTALRQLSDTLEQSQDNTEKIKQNSNRIDGHETRIEALENQGIQSPTRHKTIPLWDDDQRQTGMNKHSGVRVEMSETVDGISARLSPRTWGLEKAYLKRDGGGEVLEEIKIDGVYPGEWFYFESTLGKGEAYEIVMDSVGRNFTRGRANGVSYPVESDALSVTHGVYTNSGTTTEDYRYCIDKLAPGRDFSDRERQFGVLNDVPRDVNVVYGADTLDLSGDIGAELQRYISDLDEINHAILLPDENFRWDTHVQVPGSAEFFGLIGDGDGPHCKIRRFIDHPLTVGQWRNGVGEAIVRNITWDIDGTDPNGNNIDTGFLQVFAHSFFLVENCERIGKRQRYQRFENGIPDYLNPRGPYEDGDGVKWWHVGNAYGMFCNVLADDGVGIVQSCKTDGGINNPVADYRASHPGEGVGFSAEISEGTIYWRENIARGSVGNTYYLRTGQANGKNVVQRAEIFNGSRAAIRLGINDECYNNYVEFSDMEDRYAGSGLWFNEFTPYAEDLEIYAPDGNHELVRASSQCDGGHIKGLWIEAGPDNYHHTVRCSTISGRTANGIVIEDFYIKDESESFPGDDNHSVEISRPDVTLRNGVIDVSESPREAIGGSSEPELEDVEIIE